MKKDCKTSVDTNMELAFKQEQRILRKKYIRAFFSRKVTIVALVIVMLFALCAIFPQYLAPMDPNEMNPLKMNSGPDEQYLLGTDNFGRDVLSRLIYGTRTSFIVGVATVVLGATVGIILGIIAGYFGGLVDECIMRLSDVIRAIPQVAMASSIILIFQSSGVMGLEKRFNPGVLGLIVILSISTVPMYLKIMRAQVLQIRTADYIAARKITGCSFTRIMFKHILPNAMSPIIVMMTQGLAGSIMAESGLSFLGIGVTEPTPTWGNMLTNSRAYLLTNPISAIVPGLCLIILCVCMNTLGDALRDAMDPRYRGSM